MPEVRIRIYRHDGSAAQTGRTLLRSIDVKTKSEKRLTGKQAAQILKRECPEFELAGRVIVIKSEGGWKAMRAVQPTEKCSFHHIWEEVTISEEGYP